MRTSLLLAFLLAAAARAAAQDTLTFADGKRAPMQGDVTALSYKEVVLEIDAGGTKVPQKIPAREVGKIELDGNHKPFDFASGEDALNRGEYPLAIERFERSKRDKNDVIRQMAAIRIVQSHYAANDFAACAAAAKTLRTEKPDSFYLRESYEYEYRAHLARNDVGSLQKCIEEFEAKGKGENVKEWAKSAEVMRAQLFEFQGNWQQAIAIHKKYARDADVGEDAALGELRCLAQLKNWSELKSKSEMLISDLKGKKGASGRLLTGAYNGRGEVLLNGGSFKEALLDFMQGVLVLNRGGESSREHETAIARGAVAAARLASSGKGDKTVYKQRAQELLSELDKAYPGSPLRGDAVKALQEVK